MASFSPGPGRQRDASSRASVPSRAVGDLLFDRYRLEATMGGADRAEVWRAHDTQLERPVAVRLYPADLLPDERSRQRFGAEARAVMALAHPGIVTVHDVVLDGEMAAMVLELVDGESLADLITTRGRLPESAATAITAQVARTLQAAHDNGLVHRDVKPGNVLVSPDGRARLLDFGIAGVVDDREPGRSQPGSMMHTLRYLAPEQLADRAADRATDVFGLGTLLYEMLVGRAPFPAATPAALMAQQRLGAPQILGSSAELAGLARTALQHDRERRPRTAGRMAALLERWLENRGIAAADLAAVTAAALAGLPLPEPAPVVLPVPAVSRAPIEDQGSGPSASRAATGAGPGRAVGSSSRGSEQPPGAWPLPQLDRTAPKVPSPRGLTPFAIGRRRVPLISALGLAGLLLAGLLTSGALTALQAGAPRATASPARPSPTASPSVSPSASESSLPTAVPSASRSVAPSALPSLGLPGDDQRRRNE